MTRTITSTRSVTPTGTPTSSEPGPVISYFGILRPDGCLAGCFDGINCACVEGTPTPHIENGMTVWEAQGGGRGLLVIEARRGSNNRNPGTSFPVTAFTAQPPPDRPSLQLQTNRALGIPPKVGSTAVCDTGMPPPLGNGGGVPAVNPTNFGGGQSITNALNDYACRFTAIETSTNACSRNGSGTFAFLGDMTREQYCFNVDVATEFPIGDTVLTVQVLDTAGVPGPTARIVVRVPNPSP